MGLFLQVVLFPGGSELLCRSKFQSAAQNKDFQLDLNRCRWHLYEKGPAVLLNDGCSGYGELARDLSGRLSTPVMVLYIYDGDFWGYDLYREGEALDRFAAVPDYFAPDAPSGHSANPLLTAQCFGVEPGAIENYLIPWAQAVEGSEEEAVYAYPGDFYAAGDEWQITDFMKALGFDYDRLDPQPAPSEPSAPPHRTVPVTPTAPAHRSSGPLPDSEILPDALTSRPYILQRLEEAADACPEAAQHIRDMGYQAAVPLLTQAIQAAPEAPVLRILRAFCWNQLEGLASGMSRKPDMDRDLTKALEQEPDNIMILRARCPTAATTTRYKRHIEDLTRLIQLDPEHWDTYMTSRAYRYHWVGDDDAAKADLRTLLDRKATMTVDLSYLCREMGLIQ